MPSYSSRVPEGKFTFSSLSKARAFLLREDTLCRTYDPRMPELCPIPPECEDKTILARIDDARQLIIKADRRNYRRQVKSAAKRLMKNIRFLGKPPSGLAPENEIEAYKEWNEALKSLATAIKKSLEIEEIRRLRVIYRLEEADPKKDEEIAVLGSKAIKKIRTYFTNIKTAGGYWATQDIPEERLLDGDAEFPPQIKPTILNIFSIKIKELIDYPSDDVLAGTYLLHRLTDESAEQLGLPFGAPPPESQAALYEIRPPLSPYLGSEPTEPETVYAFRGAPAGLTRSSRAEEAVAPSHKWEQVLGPGGEDIYFKMTWHKNGREKKCAIDYSPEFISGDIILNMTGRNGNGHSSGPGAVAEVWHHEGSRGRHQLPSLTDAMNIRYKSSFLYLVRQLAAGPKSGGLSIKQFLDLITKVKKKRKGNYRKRSLKKK